MSYDISFKVKVEGSDKQVPVGDCLANTTWNLREMIVQSTGLEWINEADNGACVDVIPKIRHGLQELTMRPEEYKQYESPNGWGTINGCKEFFTIILTDWDYTVRMVPDDIIPLIRFWID